MKILCFLFCIFLHCFSKSFISDIEYGKMLYQNPRGIGCSKCHGMKGEGLVIAEYMDKNKTTNKYYNMEFKAPPINNIALQEFADGILKSKGVMPSYFLTKDEIIVLYKYIKSMNKKEK